MAILVRRLPRQALQTTTAQRRAAGRVALVIAALLIANHAWRHYIDSAAMFWLQDQLIAVVIPLLLGLWLWRKHQLAPSTYGLRNLPGPVWGNEVGMCLLAVGALTVLLLVGQVEGDIWFAAGPDTREPAPAQSLFGLDWFDAIYLALTAAVIEEVAFRGLPMIAMAPTRPGPRVAYVLVTSVAFGLTKTEAGLDVALQVMFFSVGAAIIALSSRTLWPVIVAHFVFSLFGLV